MINKVGKIICTQKLNVIAVSVVLLLLLLLFFPLMASI